MALIKSNFLSSISGSMNGTTFARNSSGSYMRNRTKPVNPNTITQVQTRAGFTNASNNWRSITQAQRDGWKVYAQNSPTTNRVGDVIHLSGFGQYMKLNGFRTFLGLAVQGAPPILYGSADAITDLNFTADISANEIEITEFAGGSLNVDANYGVWVSNPLGTGQAFYDGPWNYLGATTGDQILGFTATPPLAIASGQQFKLRVRYADQNDRLSPEYISDKVTAIA